MIRIFNHYLHRRTLMQILFDFGFIIVAVLGAVLTQVHLRSAVPNAVTYGITMDVIRHPSTRRAVSFPR